MPGQARAVIGALSGPVLCCAEGALDLSSCPGTGSGSRSFPQNRPSSQVPPRERPLLLAWASPPRSCLGLPRLPIIHASRQPATCPTWPASSWSGQVYSGGTSSKGKGTVPGDTCRYFVAQTPHLQVHYPTDSLPPGLQPAPPRATSPLYSAAQPAAATAAAAALPHLKPLSYPSIHQLPTQSHRSRRRRRRRRSFVIQAVSTSPSLLCCPTRRCARSCSRGSCHHHHHHHQPRHDLRYRLLLSPANVICQLAHLCLVPSR